MNFNFKKRVALNVSSSVTAMSLALLLISCSKKPEYATSAVASDFDGQWSGAWSWHTNSTSFIEISNGRVKIKELPLETEPADTIAVVSTEGEVRFANEYGSKRAPCVLLYLDAPKHAVPVYISKDKTRLIYNVDLNRERRIVFDKVLKKEIGREPGSHQ